MAPGASSENEVEFASPDGVSPGGPRVTKNAGGLRETFRWQFDECSGDVDAADKLVRGAIRYAERCSAEMEFLRCSSRSAHTRTSVSFSARAYASLCSGLAWFLHLALLSRVAHVLNVEPRRLLEGIVDSPNLSGSP